MAHITGATRVAETSTSTGTGNITVAGAHESGDRTLASVMTTNGDTMDVHIKHTTLGEWEHCRVTRVSATEFSRATPFASSNAGAVVSFSTGGLIVFTPRGEREVALDNQSVVGLPLADSASPTPPSAGVGVYVADLAGAAVLSQVRANEVGHPLQAAMFGKRVMMVTPKPGVATAPDVIGYVISTSGTLTARVPAATNLFTSSRRFSYVSAATAGSTALVRGTGLQYWRGNAAGLGGFFFNCRFGVSDAAVVADSRLFIGLYASVSSIGNVNPSTLTGIIGVGADNGEVNLSIMHNDGAGVATKVALGANFPAQTLSTDLYELSLFCAPNASSVKWRLARLNTADVAEGTITTDLPATTAFMCPQVWRNNGATALAVGLDIGHIYGETTY